MGLAFGGSLVEGVGSGLEADGSGLGTLGDGAGSGFGSFGGFITGAAGTFEVPGGSCGGAPFCFGLATLGGKPAMLFLLLPGLSSQYL